MFGTDITTYRPHVPAKKPKIAAYRPKHHIKKPKIYLGTDRECGRCGSNKTYDKIINRVQWHREIDENGKWTKKWLCNSCYHKDINQKHKREAELVRKIQLKIKDSQ